MEGRGSESKRPGCQGQGRFRPLVPRLGTCVTTARVRGANGASGSTVQGGHTAATCALDGDRSRSFHTYFQEDGQGHAQAAGDTAKEQHWCPRALPRLPTPTPPPGRLRKAQVPKGWCPACPEPYSLPHTSMWVSTAQGGNGRPRRGGGKRRHPAQKPKQWWPRANGWTHKSASPQLILTSWRKRWPGAVTGSSCWGMRTISRQTHRQPGGDHLSSLNKTGHR